MKQAPLALPVCPYCGEHFSYKTVFKSKSQSDVQCPKCKQNFKITLETPFSILITVVVLIAVAINVALAIFLPNMNVLYMAGVMACGVAAVILLIPFVVRYVKPEQMKYSTRTTEFKQ